MKTCIICNRLLRTLVIDPDYPGTATWVEMQGPYCNWHDWYDYDPNIKIKQIPQA